MHTSFGLREPASVRSSSLYLSGKTGVFVLLVASASSCQPVRTSPEPSVVVEEVGAGGAAEKAGLRAGDELLAWNNQGAGGAGAKGGSLREPFEVGEVEMEEGPRGHLVLHGRRHGQELAWPVPDGNWNITVRPALSTPHLARYEAALRRRVAQPAERAGDMAHERLSTLASELQAEGAWREACWILLGIAQSRMQQAELRPKAGQDFDQVRSVARAAGSLVVEARAWEAEGAAAFKSNERDRALESYRQALNLREELAAGGENLRLALAQSRLAIVAFQSVGKIATAEDLWKRSVAIGERQAPDSLPTATSLNGLGAINLQRGDLELGMGFLRKALAIRERLAAGTLDHAKTLGNLGIALREQGDLTGAEDLHLRGLEILKKVAPENEIATGLFYLGQVAKDRGEWEAAEAYLRHALAIQERFDPKSRFVVSCLNNLGDVYAAVGQLQDAEASYRRSLQLARELWPGDLRVAINLNNLGDVIAASGDLAQARQLLQESLTLHYRLAPESLDLAQILWSVGELARRERRFSVARRFHEDALAIRRRLAPRSAKEAESLDSIGRVLREQGRVEAAQEYWTKAVEVLESQRGRQARSDQAKTAFGARYTWMFRDLVELLVERGRVGEAFHLLERARARSFLAMLAERDGGVAAVDAPAVLLQQLREIDAEYDRVQRRLAADPNREPREIDKLHTDLEELRGRRGQIMAAVRVASPRIGSLQEPEILDVQGASRALDLGTLLLSYSVGRSKTLLFALPAATEGTEKSSLQLFVIPVGEKELRSRIETFRGFIDRGRDTPETERPLLRQASRLFRDVLGPVRELVLSSRRVLLVPDGPLQALPFAALLDDGPPSHFLAEIKPLHLVASVTIYAELAKTRRTGPERAGPVLVAFGDPEYPPESLRRLRMLPASRAEVEAITALYADRAVAYLGSAATEQRAKALGLGPRFIHFACHGVLDERVPLNSALALTPSRDGHGADNGLLQTWEILEWMRIDAELVTLSACESGLGKEMGAEGLIGLTRAFQHAGARSVLSSMWAVSDRSTAEWMGHFYAALKRGTTKDEALQVAQAEMRRRPAYAHPFHWAAFQLSGRWN